MNICQHHLSIFGPHFVTHTCYTDLIMLLIHVPKMLHRADCPRIVTQMTSNSCLFSNSYSLLAFTGAGSSFTFYNESKSRKQMHTKLYP